MTVETAAPPERASTWSWVLLCAGMLLALWAVSAAFGEPRLDPDAAEQSSSPNPLIPSGAPYEVNAWARIARGDGEADIEDVQLAGDALFALFSNGTLFRSTDFGKSWQRLGGLPAVNDRSGIPLLQAGTSRVWVAGSLGIFSSDNNGNTWQRQDTPALARPVTALRTTPDGKSAWAFADNALFTYRAGEWTRFSQPTRIVVRQAFTAASLRNPGVVWFANDLQAVRVDASGTMQPFLFAASVRDVNGPKSTAFAVGDDDRVWVGLDTGQLAHLDSLASGWVTEPVPGAKAITAIGLLSGGELGWVLDSGRRVFVKSTGEPSWVATDPLPKAGHIDALVAKDQRRFALTDKQTLWYSPDGGQSYGRRLVAHERFGRPSFERGGMDGVVGTSTGAVLHTMDGGATWTSRVTAHHARDWVVRKGSTWRAGGPGGTVVSEDGGGHWRIQDLVSRPRVTFNGDSALVSVTDETAVERTRDLGAKWTRSEQLAQGQYPIGPVVFASDNKHGISLGSAEVALTEDGGTTWRVNQFAEDVSFLAAAYFQETPTGLVVDDDGGVRKFEAVGAGAVVWKASAALRAVATAGKQFVWVGGDNGVGARSIDGGKNWVTFSFPESANISQLTALDTAKLLAFGNGVIFRSSDAGLTWQRAANERPVPRWVYLFSLLAFFALVSGTASLFSPPQPQSALQRAETIEARLVTDRPIQSQAEDKLGAARIAYAISRFMRNDKTEAPVTIAVDAPWGVGKSSVLALLARDLRGNGFHPIEFNAWHQEKNSNILASFLQSVVDGSIPRGVASLPFRLRLLRRRLRTGENWLLFLCVFALTAIIVCAVRQPRSVEYASTQLQKLSQLRVGALTSVSLGGSLGPLGCILSTGAFAFALFKESQRTLKAFGFDAAAILGGVIARSDPQLARKRVVFRERFARDFADVTEALAPARVVILVDDLDRCSPKCVAEVLEAVDFLVSSGRCFVVLGVWRDAVRRALDVQLRRTKSTADATRFLEKLIHVNVSLRPLTSAQYSLLLDVEGPNEALRAAPARKAFILAERALEVLRPALPALFIAASLCVAAWLGTSASELVRTAQKNDSSKPAVAPSATPAAPNSGTTSNPPPPPPSSSGAGPLIEQTQVVTRAPTLSADADAASPDHLPLYLGGALLLFCSLGLYLSWRVERGIHLVREPVSFTDALLEWVPVIRISHDTPRSLKRFLNIVRFLAGFRDASVPPLETRAERWERSWREEKQAWQRRLRRLRRKGGEEPAPNASTKTGPVPSDSDLIGLAAVQALAIEHQSNPPAHLKQIIEQQRSRMGHDVFAQFKELITITERETPPITKLPVSLPGSTSARNARWRKRR